MITPQTLKGFRDFLPPEARKRQFAIDIIRRTFESFGYEPLESPAVEYLETFSGNIGEDEQLFFKFTDAGGRQVALRYDQTVPSCRILAQYPDKIKLPFKRYQIQTVWRAEKPQKGRYREFLQCDADIFGISGYTADAETIALSLTCFINLGFKKPIALINDRELYKDISYEDITAIDKLAKIGADGVITLLSKNGRNQSEAKKLLDKIKNLEPTPSLFSTFQYLDSMGLSANYRFSPTLARSFSYSTGVIWEIIDEQFSAGSLAGGERYDKLISRFTKKDIPAVGFAIGFDRALLAMDELNLFPPTNSPANVLIATLDSQSLNYAASVAQKLRAQNLKVDLYPDPDKKIDQQIKFASEKNIPTIIIIGENELKNQTVTVKNMSTRTQKTISLDSLPHELTTQ